MFTDILLASHPSEACQWAADAAFSFARQHEAQLRILHVCGPPAYDWADVRYLAPSGEVARVKTRVEDFYKEKISDIANANVDVVPGMAHSEILRAARKMNIDLIVMGSRTKVDPARRATTWGMTGSTLERVSQKAHCPVMIVSRQIPEDKMAFKTIVMATDFSKQAECAKNYAAQMARQYQARLIIVHVLDVGTSVDSMRTSQEEIERAVEETKARLAEEYADAVKGLASYAYEVWEGTPAVEILKLARKESADLIVMAHHAKETDPEKAYLGSTVAQVALRAGCPTISINRHFDLRCALY